MKWSIDFGPGVQRQIDKLDRPIACRILRFLFDRIEPLEDPRSVGEALHGPELGKYWKYRVGDYRVIVLIEDNVLRILVVRIAHRSEAYR